MKMSQEKLHWSVTAITPIHITNNTFLQEEKDFYVEAGILHRINYPLLLTMIPEEEFDSCLSQIKNAGIRSLVPKPNKKEKKTNKSPTEDWKQILRSKVGIEESDQDSQEEDGEQENTEKSLLEMSEIYRCNLDFSKEEAYGKIQEMAVDTFGRVFIAGSSLKGALRTALYFFYLSQHPHVLSRLRFTWTEDPLEADYPLFLEMTDMVRKNVRKDFFRQLCVQNTNLIPSYESIKVYQLKILNIGLADDEEQVLWKKGMKQSVSSFKEAETLCWEMIAPQTRFHTEIIIDHDLKDIFYQEKQSPAFRFSSQNIMQSLRAFGMSIAQKEWEFAQKYNISFLKDFYQDILSKAKNSQEGKEAYIPIGSGTPWHSKTIGNLLDRSSLDSIRRHFFQYMGKFVHNTCQASFNGQRVRKGVCPRCAKLLRSDKLSSVDPFPKTRHIIFQEGQPVLPPGWIKICAD